MRDLILAAYLTSKADALFELELYLVVLYEGWTCRRHVLEVRLTGLPSRIAKRSSGRRWFQPA